MILEKHPYKDFIEKNHYKVINCKSCGFWHVYPMPTDKELAAYYEKKYYVTLGTNRSMTDKASDPDGFYTVLDIGAGYGDFLRFMANKGWKTQGVELSRQAHESIHDSRTLNIKHGSIEDLATFDFKPASVVTLNNVLEHLRQPRETLEIIKKKFLLSDGIIMVIVPNDFNPLQELINMTILKNNKEKKYYWVAPPDHLNYWSIRTFMKFARTCGFRIMHSTVDFPMELFPLAGEDYISHPEVGRKAHLKRVDFEKHLQETRSFALKDSLYGLFAKHGIGRDMQFIIAPQDNGDE
jgi:SAM-dependent methyltransferase